MSLINILIIVLLLASFVFAFLSARTWHWGYVVLVELLFIMNIVFFFLAAETLRINAITEAQFDKLEKQVKLATADNEAIKYGTRDTTIINRVSSSGETPVKVAEGAEFLPSIEQLDHELLIANRLRGRVWRNVNLVGAPDVKNGVLKVNVVAPAPPPAPAAADGEAPATPPTAPAAPAAPPAGLKADTVVYVFEESLPNAQRPAQYIGEFTVSQVAGTQATLTLAFPPVSSLTANDLEVKRLASTRGPFVVYETMPLDRYEIFKSMSEDDLKKLLPPKAVAEYTKHGKVATTDDDPWRKVGVDADGNPLPADQADKAVKTIYQRRLREYAAEIDELHRRRIAMIAEMDAVQKDIDQLIAAEAVAKNIQNFRTEERRRLTADLAGITKEREAVESHLAQVQQLLAKARQLTEAAMARNRQILNELSARQLSKKPLGDGSSTPAKPAVPLALGAAN